MEPEQPAQAVPVAHAALDFTDDAAGQATGSEERAEAEQGIGCCIDLFCEPRDGWFLQSSVAFIVQFSCLINVCW